MTEDEKLVGALCDPKRLDAINPDARRRLWRFLMDSLTPQDDSPSDEAMADFVPLDLPLSWDKNGETGVLQIVTTVQLGGRQDRPTRTRPRLFEVTPAAQKLLIGIFAESIAADEAAGRIPTTPPSLQ